MLELLKIRKFSEKDINIVLDLHKKSMELIDAYKGDGPWDNDLIDIQKHYFNNSGIFLVGEINNKIVTMGAFRKIDKNTAEIKRMRTYPEYQGNAGFKEFKQEVIDGFNCTWFKLDL